MMIVQTCCTRPSCIQTSIKKAASWHGLAWQRWHGIKGAMLHGLLAPILMSRPYCLPMADAGREGAFFHRRHHFLRVTLAFCDRLRLRLLERMSNSLRRAAGSSQQMVSPMFFS